jgi:hypothetical protein
VAVFIDDDATKNAFAPTAQLGKAPDPNAVLPTLQALISYQFSLFEFKTAGATSDPKTLSFLGDTNKPFAVENPGCVAERAGKLLLTDCLVGRGADTLAIQVDGTIGRRADHSDFDLNFGQVIVPSGFTDHIKGALDYRPTLLSGTFTLNLEILFPHGVKIVVDMETRLEDIQLVEHCPVGGAIRSSLKSAGQSGAANEVTARFGPTCGALEVL